jgi:hypothetical protein
MRRVFAGLYALDGEGAAAAVALGLADPESYVLKPQREGRAGWLGLPPFFTTSRLFYTSFGGPNTPASGSPLKSCFTRHLAVQTPVVDEPFI